MIFLTDSTGGALLRVHAQARASRTAVVGIYGDNLKIAVQAPPVDSAANEAIRDFLSDLLEHPASKIILKSGASGRKKIFILAGMSLEEAKRRLDGKVP